MKGRVRDFWGLGGGKDVFLGCLGENGVEGVLGVGGIGDYGKYD